MKNFGGKIEKKWGRFQCNIITTLLKKEEETRKNQEIKKKSKKGDNLAGKILEEKKEKS